MSVVVRDRWAEKLRVESSGASTWMRLAQVSAGCPTVWCECGLRLARAIVNDRCLPPFTDLRDTLVGD
jgi:hypothetical protein